MKAVNIQFLYNGQNNNENFLYRGPLLLYQLAYIPTFDLRTIQTFGNYYWSYSYRLVAQFYT